MKIRNYFHIHNYIYRARHLLGIRPRPQTNKTPGQTPVFWTGSGGCGFLRVHGLLQTNGQPSVFFKSTAKLQNQRVDAQVDLVWKRAADESAHVQRYFGKHGVYDHHIAPYTIQYAPEIIRHFNGKAIFLCLRSAKSIDSLWIQWGYRNPLTTDRTRKNRYPVELFPDLSDATHDSKEATQQYYDLYYKMAEQYQAAYPDNFLIVDADRFFTDQNYFTSINERFDLNLKFKESHPECDNQMITTALCGGIGNNLFQMAEPVAFCAEHGLPQPQFATWDMSDFPAYYRNDRFIGGHSGKPEDLQNTFSHIKWVPPSRATFDDKFVVNDMFAFADVHHQRKAILDYFEPSLEVKGYIQNTYPAIQGQNTISLHYRVGGLQADTHAFNALNADWYKRIFTDYFPNPHDCFVFSDNIESAKRLIEELQKVTPHTYHLIDEGVFNSLIMMSMCKNHVLSNSTLSFWGAYLDPQQPAGTTILHHSFMTYHSEPHIECRMIPYQEWKIV